jgi:hypothetical protein
VLNAVVAQINRYRKIKFQKGFLKGFVLSKPLLFLSNKPNVMKILSFLAVAMLAFIACEEDKKKSEAPTTDISTAEPETSKEDAHPVPLKEVLKAHGGLGRWQQMKNICFEIERGPAVEVHTVSLPDRMVKIESNNWSMGSDGNQLWLLENKPNTYQGDPNFYHNLMFYFFAMPFVLADPGIEYSEVKGTELDGIVYEGIKINFKQDVGFSPKDEYILYYRPETFRMAWLAYTVTRGAETVSTDWNFIKYDSWQEVNGFQLPKELVWYNVEDGKPLAARNRQTFDRVVLTETILDKTVFSKPELAQEISN